MSRFKKNKKKSGFVLVYIMYLGFLVLIIAVMLFRIELDRNKALNAYFNMDLSIQGKLDAISLSREKLLTQLYKLLIDIAMVQDKEQAVNYLSSSYSGVVASEGSTTLSYNSAKELVEFKYSLNFVNYTEYYDIVFQNNKIKFVLANQL